MKDTRSKDTELPTLPLSRVPAKRRDPTDLIIGLLSAILVLGLSVTAFTFTLAALGAIPLGVLGATLLGLGIAVPLATGILVASTLLILTSIGVIGASIDDIVQHEKKENNIRKERKEYIKQHPNGKIGYKKDLEQQNEINQLIRRVEDHAVPKIVEKLLDFSGHSTIIQGSDFTNRQSGTLYPSRNAVAQVVDDITIKILTNQKGAKAPVDAKKLQWLKDNSPETLGETIANKITRNMEFMNHILLSTFHRKSILTSKPYKRFYEGYFGSKPLDVVTFPFQRRFVNINARESDAESLSETELSPSPHVDRLAKEKQAPKRVSISVE
ncbi:MAG: hypothetical protein K0R63_859 [Rickettsiales bacterium]|jgi:hypothetical protein|nr:hypothetical protein [Rickettsiales bacterium]